MAQDTRPYKSKEQDGNGNEIIIRDQQLVEQSSQTTMASGEYFEIVDVDGRMAKIPKDNMISVVREALGSLLNGLSDQTTVTKIPTLNGNTLGASAAATLASVLGVGTMTATNDISRGVICVNSTNTDGPEGGWWTIFYFPLKGTQYCLEFAHPSTDATTPKLYFRYTMASGVKSSWIQLNK